MAANVNVTNCKVLHYYVTGVTCSVTVERLLPMAIAIVTIQVILMRHTDVALGSSKRFRSQLSVPYNGYYGKAWLKS